MQKQLPLQAAPLHLQICKELKTHTNGLSNCDSPVYASQHTLQANVDALAISLCSTASCTTPPVSLTFRATPMRRRWCRADLRMGLSIYLMV